MTMHSYSNEIAMAIHNHLKNNHLLYSFDEERGVFNLLMGVGGKAKTLIYHIIVHEHGFTSNVRYPLGPSSADEDCLNTMAKFLHRVNHGLRNGNFELDMDDGEIDYKSYCCCRGLVSPTDEMVSESIQCPAAMFDKYEAGILGILFNGMTDREAEKRCEGNQGSILSKLEELKEQLEALKGSESREAENDPEEADPSEKDAPFSFEDFLMMLAEKAASDEDGADGMIEADIIDAE